MPASGWASTLVRHQTEWLKGTHVWALCLAVTLCTICVDAMLSNYVCQITINQQAGFSVWCRQPFVIAWAVAALARDAADGVDVANSSEFT